MMAKIVKEIHHCDDYDSAHGAHTAKDLAGHASRNDVTVADCGHGDDGPPESVRYALESRVRLHVLAVVDYGREDQHGHAQVHDEHGYLFHTLTSCPEHGCFVNRTKKDLNNFIKISTIHID